MMAKATQGVKNLYYAIATVAENGDVTYSAPKKASDLQKVTINIKSSADKEYAEDTVCDVINSFEGGTIAIENYGIDNATLAEWEGRTVDSNKVLVYKSTDDLTAPYLAIGFESQKRDKSIRFTWLALCKKTNDSENYETKQAKVKGQSQTSTFEILERADNVWRYRVDSNDNATSPMTSEKWFAKVYDGTVA